MSYLRRPKLITRPTPTPPSSSHTLRQWELAYIDPADNWTLTAPAVTDRHDGAQFAVGVDTLDGTDVTIAAQGTTTFFDPSIGLSTATIQGQFYGDTVWFIYDADQDQWRVLSITPLESEFGILSSPTDFSPGSSYTPIQNWNASTSSPLFADPNATTGEITIPRTAGYQITSNLVFTQSNTNKELAILLWLRSSLNPDVVISVMAVSDDKTNVRQLQSAIYYPGTEGEVLQLGMSWVNQTIGTAGMYIGQFAVTLNAAGFD